MLSKWFCVFLLTLVARDITADGDYIDVAQYNAVYYNLITREGLKGELEDVTRRPLSQARIAFRGASCQCKGLTCSCCTGINIAALNFDRSICTNFTYDPAELGIKLAVLSNDNVIYTNSLSARNPPAFCLPFSPLPAVNFCVRFFNIYASEKNLHACVDFETRVVNWPILILHFNCVKVGLDGISWTNPDGSNLLQMRPGEGEVEIYDEVNFEQESEFSTNRPSTLTPQEEASIGQLKL